MSAWDDVDLGPLGSALLASMIEAAGPLPDGYSLHRVEDPLGFGNKWRVQLPSGNRMKGDYSSAEEAAEAAVEHAAMWA